LFAQVALVSLSVGTLAAPAFSSQAVPDPMPKADRAKPSDNNLEDSPKKVVDEVWQLINNEFVDKGFNHVDWLAKRQELLDKNYSSPKQAYKEVVKALKSLGDPYTRFLSPDDFQNLTNQTAGDRKSVV
jgi:carboxyl-terminal processing protease